MNTLQRLLDITSRIEHLEQAAQWITRETVHTDNGVSQTGTLITVLADELRERMYDLVRQVEREFDYEKLNDSPSLKLRRSELAFAEAAEAELAFLLVRSFG